MVSGPVVCGMVTVTVLNFSAMSELLARRRSPERRGATGLGPPARPPLGSDYVRRRGAVHPPGQAGSDLRTPPIPAGDGSTGFLGNQYRGQFHPTDRTAGSAESVTSTRSRNNPQCPGFEDEKKCEKPANSD